MLRQPRPVRRCLSVPERYDVTVSTSSGPARARALASAAVLALRDRVARTALRASTRSASSMAPLSPTPPTSPPCRGPSLRDNEPVDPEQPVERVWRPSWPCAMGATLSILRRGSGDPDLPHGPRRHRVARVPHSRGAGDPAAGGTARRRRGARNRLGQRGRVGTRERAAMLGADDDPTGFAPTHPVLADIHRRRPNWRVTSTGRVMEALVPAIIEQKVTGQEALGGFRLAGAPLRRACARSRGRTGCLAAAVGGDRADDPFVGVAAHEHRPGEVPCGRDGRPGGGVAGADRRASGRTRRTAGCGPCRASACGRVRRCASVRTATPTR